MRAIAILRRGPTLAHSSRTALAWSYFGQASRQGSRQVTGERGAAARVAELIHGSGEVSAVPRSRDEVAQHRPSPFDEGAAQIRSPRHEPLCRITPIDLPTRWPEACMVQTFGEAGPSPPRTNTACAAPIALARRMCMVLASSLLPLQTASMATTARSKRPGLAVARRRWSCQEKRRARKGADG